MVYVDLGKVLHIVSQGTCVVSSFFFFPFEDLLFSERKKRLSSSSRKEYRAYT